MKEVNTYKRSKHLPDVYLSIYSLIEKGFCPAQIAPKIGKTKQALNRYIMRLKVCKAISKVSYGVWQTHGIDRLKEVNRSKHITARPSSHFISSTVCEGGVRGHAFRFSVVLPRVSGWFDRRRFFRLKKIPFKSIPYGESLEIRGHRVKVFDRSLDVYFYPGWSAFSDDAEVSYAYAVLELNHVLTRFENLVGVNVRPYRFSVSRQHYSLVKNALAKQYLKDRVKLEVFNPDGSKWFIIDNSYHLEEAESCHKEDARTDTRKVQDFFNGVKQTGITPGFILQGFDSLIKDRQFYAENNRKHVEVIGALGDSVKELTRVVKGLKKGGDFE